MQNRAFILSTTETKHQKTSREILDSIKQVVPEREIKYLSFEDTIKFFPLSYLRYVLEYIEKYNSHKISLSALYETKPIAKLKAIKLVKKEIALKSKI